MADDAKKKLAGILALELGQLQEDVKKANDILNQIGKDAKFEGITKNLSAQIKKAVEEGTKNADLSKLGFGSKGKSNEQTSAYREAMTALKQQQQYKQAILSIDKQMVAATGAEATELAKARANYVTLEQSARATAVSAKARVSDSKELAKISQQESVNEAKVYKLNADVERVKRKTVENQQKQNKEVSVYSQLLVNIVSLLSTMAIHMASNAVRQFWVDSIKYASEYYDKLNEIRIVTLMSEEDAEKLGARYQELAKEMSVSSKDLVSGATVFFRQGLGTEEVEERLKATTMYAKTAGVSFEDAANMITASVNSIEKDALGMEMTAQRVADVYLYLGDNAATSGRHICPIAA